MSTSAPEGGLFAEPGRGGRRPILTVSGLSAWYGELRALHDVSFEVARGLLHGILVAAHREAGQSLSSPPFAISAYGREAPEAEVRVRSHRTRKDNRVVELQLEPGGSPFRPAPRAALVEVSANRREPAE